MHPILDALPISNARFHCCAGSFPLNLCTYVLLDEDGNDTSNLEQPVIIRVTALNGERFRLHDPRDIQRFLAVIGRLTDKVAS